VVGIAVLCLIVAGIAQAQFGKLKSLTKQKLGVQTTQQDAASPAEDNSSSDEEGEAKAIYAPGVKKSLNVRRKGDPTPEATASAIEGGRKQEVSIAISKVDATIFDAVRGYKPCNRLENFRILSPTQVKVTIDLTGIQQTDDCSIYFVSGDRPVLYANLDVMGRESVEEKRRADAMQSESQLSADQQLALGKKRMGKLWTVTFANGKTDRWTLTAPSGDGISYRFKSASGKSVEITHSLGAAMIQMGDCTMQARIEGKSAEGVALDSCGVPAGTKFTAAIQ
jgi:hypothetical protein